MKDVLKSLKDVDVDLSNETKIKNIKAILDKKGILIYGFDET